MSDVFDDFDALLQNTEKETRTRYGPSGEQRRLERRRQQEETVRLAEEERIRQAREADAHAQQAKAREQIKREKERRLVDEECELVLSRIAAQRDLTVQSVTRQEGGATKIVVLAERKNSWGTPNIDVGTGIEAEIGKCEISLDGRGRTLKGTFAKALKGGAIVLHNAALNPYLGVVVGEAMQAGRAHFVLGVDYFGKGRKCIAKHVGTEMIGGALQFECDVIIRESIGDRMKGGVISIHGDLREWLDNEAECRVTLGHEMMGGEIRIYGGVAGQFHAVGEGMTDGFIAIHGNMSVIHRVLMQQRPCHIGRRMSGGRIEIGESLLASPRETTIGSEMMAGEIVIKGDVLSKSGLPLTRIGNGMTGGRIVLERYRESDHDQPRRLVLERQK